MPFAPPFVPPKPEEEVHHKKESLHDDEWHQGIWAVTREQLARLTEYDNSLLGTLPKTPIPLVARLYVAYNEIVKRLDWVWGKTYQYQKSQAMRRFVDAAATRMEELKDNLTELDMSEFHYLDNQLVELKFIPRDLQLIPLSAYPVERSAQLQELAERLYRGERIYVEPTSDEQQQEGEEDDVVEAKVEAKVHADLEAKIANRPVVEKKFDPFWNESGKIAGMLQRHERARCLRLEFLDGKIVFLMRRNTSALKSRPKKDVSAAAATNIQKLWRGFRARRDYKTRHNRRRMLIGMDVPSWRSTKLQDNLKGIEAIKKKRRLDKVQEYIDTCLKEKERVLRVVAPGLMEDISDEIRLWFRNWYDVANAFDKFPSIEKGGTILVVRGETLTPEQYLVEEEKKRILQEQILKNPGIAQKMEKEAERLKKKLADEKAREKKRLKKERKEARRRKKLGIIDPFTFKEGPAFAKMNAANQLFDEDWNHIDEAVATKEENLVVSRITDQVCYEVQLEMRQIVDEMMRLELEQLEFALERDKNPKKKIKPKPKPKPPKPKTKKGKKDPTGTRDIEDLFQELFDHGIIRTYPETDLNDFIGDYAYANLDIRAVDLDPDPAVGEAKQLALSNCILPLGGEDLPKPRSVLIFGPRQSGKKVLVNAICTATSAVLFDISPKVTAGLYPGRKATRMLVHLINKMSRILQPSVIFVNGAEKMFYTKIPNEEKSWDTKKLKSQLHKHIVKTIKPEDRVMVIGTTNQPWAGSAGPLRKAYEKFIMVPRTDYGTVYQLLMDILMKYHAVARDINVSALAKLCIGYTVPYIRHTVDQIMTPRRIIRLKFDPLRQHELLEGLMHGNEPEPITAEEQARFTQWYRTKTKLGKLKTKTLAPLRLERVQEAEKIKKLEDAKRTKQQKKEKELKRANQ